MALFSKNNREDEQDDVRNPIDEIQSNKDFSANTFVSGNNPSNSNTDLKMTNISNNATLEGIIKVEGDITVNGKVKGSITAKGRAIIEPSGIVEGDILAQNADISGTVTGKVEIAELLSLKGAAKINGDIYTDKLVIEKEASFNGKCVMGKNAVSKAPGAPSSTDNKPKTNTLNA